MLTRKYKALLTQLEALKQALILIFRADHLLCTLLVVTIPASGILPVLAIQASTNLIDYLTSVQVTVMSTIIQHLLYWGILWLVHDLMSPWIAFLQSNLADKAVLKVNQSIINKSNAIQGLAYFEQQEFHDELQVILNESYYKPINLVVSLVGLLRELMLAISCMVLLYSKVAWLSVFTLASMVVHAGVIINMQEEMWKETLGNSPNARKMNYISNLSVDPHYAKEIRLFPIGSYLYKEYNKLFWLVYSSMFRLRRKQVLRPMLSSLIALAGNLAALYYLTLLIGYGKLRIGAIALLLQTLAQLHQSVLKLGEDMGWITNVLLFFEKYFLFLDKEEKVYPQAIVQNSRLDYQQDLHIAFDHVSFVYPDGRQVLEDISFEVQPKEKLAVVGANGAGKTTLIKLLCGFYPPSAGTIWINNLPIDQYDLTALRALIAPVFQDFGTYAFSLKQNIMMGDEADHEEKLKVAIQEAGVVDFIDRLQEQLEQPLSKMFGGIELSGGQWQKVAIARALYKDASLLILDEPTAALDPISENKVFEQFMKLSQDKTTLFITHRLTSVGMADRILLLDRGKKVGLASHSQLLRHNTLYKEMFESQASKYLALMHRNPKILFT